MAQGRGKAQADALRQAKQDVQACLILDAYDLSARQYVQSSTLKKGDLVLAEAGSIIPADGEVIAGAASVDESAITGDSAPVIREAGGDRSAVTGGTTVLSYWNLIQVSCEADNSFLDKMIAMVEYSAFRSQKP